MRKKILVTVVLLLVTAILTSTVLAQGAFRVYDDFGQINEMRIKRASEPLLDMGFQVYVCHYDYTGPVVDESGNQTDQWYNYRIQRQVADGLTLDSKGTLANTTLIINVDARGRDVRFDLGNGSILNPLYYADHSKIESIKGKVMNGVAEDEPTRGFVAALEDISVVLGAVEAGPAPVVTATPLAPPTATPVPPPTSTPFPFPTPVPFMERENVRPVARGLGTAFIFLLGLGGLGALIWFVALPLARRQQKRAQYGKQIERVKGFVSHIISICVSGDLSTGILSGANAKKTPLYTFWKRLDGPKDPRQDETFRRLISEAQDSLAIIQIAYSDYREKASKKGELSLAELKSLVGSWEEILLSLVGADHKSILSMSEDDLRGLLNPFSMVPPEVWEEDSELVRQVQAILDEIESSDKTPPNLMVADPGEVDPQGVVGRIEEAKYMLYRLGEARKKARPRFKEVIALRKQKSRKSSLPKAVLEQDAFAYPDKLLADARNSLERELWLGALESTERAEDALGRIPQVIKALCRAEDALQSVSVPRISGMSIRKEVLAPLKCKFQSAVAEMRKGQYEPAVGQAKDLVGYCSQTSEVLVRFRANLAGHQRRRSAIEAIGKRGFDLASVQDEFNEVAVDITTAADALRTGNITRAKEYVEELKADSQRALEQSRLLVALYKSNRSRLEKLAEEVARITEILEDEAQPAWETLRVYPESNWGVYGGAVSAARSTLEHLFDDPSDSKDLASKIQTLNEKKSADSLHKAERRLDKAFSDLREAEGRLRGIIAQLDRVLELKKNVPNMLSTAEDQWEAVCEFRDSADRSIDERVDDLLLVSLGLLNDGKDSLSAREFTEAAAEIEKAVVRIDRAFSSAKEQKALIADLLEKMEVTSGSSRKRVRKAARVYHEMVPAAQKSTTGGALVNAENLLRKAKSLRDSMGGLEDHEWSSALRKTIKAFRDAEQKASEVICRVREDKSEYESWIAKANRRINSAASAISTAERYTSDFDAQNAGLGTLNRAKREKPSRARVGDSLDAISRKIGAAKRAGKLAEDAERQARNRIAAVEAARERERQRRLAEKRAKEAAERARRETARREARERRAQRNQISTRSASRRSVPSRSAGRRSL